MAAVDAAFVVGREPWKKADPDWVKAWQRELYARDDGHSSDIRRRGYTHLRYARNERAFWRVLQNRVALASSAYGNDPTPENNATMQARIDDLNSGSILISGDAATEGRFKQWLESIPSVTDEEWAEGRRLDDDYINRNTKKKDRPTKKQRLELRRSELKEEGIEVDDAEELQQRGIDPKTLEPLFNYEAHEAEARGMPGEDIE